ncbi:DUF4919 domain-containing protein [Janibacter hoylei]|uniref:DUF4919 domain-containing protein n=1 Tax=Janibacter hoylei TaxID=364298 RepID=UPI0021A57A8E|nr:DUF4919 domain-containing protein [Janibacter hoylei]MCT1618993.1 DUF4919 domain-containing protein [Janibacter hoylei]MCT2292632.1 DUF4919 domain-containing protein [Janibacter hoylei]
MTEAHAQTLRELVTRYLTEQTPANLTALRHAVRSSGSFDPDVDLRGVIPLLEAGRHREALDAVHAKMPGAALNPLAHRLLAAAHEALGDDDAARREATLHTLSVSSVLATGDGTQERPWSVLRVADEYDVMRAKGVTPRRQATRTVDGRVVDVHEVVDGPDVWFVLDPA